MLCIVVALVFGLVCEALPSPAVSPPSPPTWPRQYTKATVTQEFTALGETAADVVRIFSTKIDDVETRIRSHIELYTNSTFVLNVSIASGPSADVGTARALAIAVGQETQCKAYGVVSIVLQFDTYVGGEKIDESTKEWPDLATGTLKACNDPVFESIQNVKKFV